MDSRICQTSTASPAEPGGLSFWASKNEVGTFPAVRHCRRLYVSFARQFCWTPTFLYRRSLDAGPTVSLPLRSEPSCR